MTEAELSLNRNEKLPLAKLHIAQYIVALVLLVLGVGLWRLQVVGADSYRVLAEENRVRKVPVLAPRGRLLDREGRILVDNYPSVTCYLLREKERSVAADLPFIAQGLHMPLEQLQAIVQHFSYAPGTSHRAQAGHHTGRASLYRGIATSFPSWKPWTSSAAFTPAMVSWRT